LLPGKAFPLAEGALHVHGPVRALTAKAGYTVTGVAANAFTVTGASATNAINSGAVAAVFPATAAPTFAVGDVGPSGVGIVFYVTGGGLHGLEAAPSNWKPGSLDPQAKWKVDDTTTSGTGTAFGTGAANTAALAGSAHPAAELCRDYSGGGRTDWYLPSKDELNLLYVNRSILGTYEQLYWSSSGEPTSWSQLFDPSGVQIGYAGNGLLCYVRPVRSF
jgi:hypothetical protein